MHTQVSLSCISQLIAGTHENPSSVLGPHPVDYLGSEAVAVRTLLPNAKAAWIIDRQSGLRRPMRRLHPAGFFEAICHGEVDETSGSVQDVAHGKCNTSRYRIQMTDKTGEIIDMQDQTIYRGQRKSTKPCCSNLLMLGFRVTKHGVGWLGKFKTKSLMN